MAAESPSPGALCGADGLTSALPPGPGPAWLVWAALGVVYLVWGSTYLAIRIMVETVPPLLGAGMRFFLAGAILLGAVAALRGWRTLILDRRSALSALAVGFALAGANAIITVAEQEVPSALAALLVATVPLWVVLLRRGSGESIAGTTVIAIAAGFVGVAVLLRPGAQTDGASMLALATILFAALMWAAGSVASPRLPLPVNPFSSTGWQMLLGGAVWLLAGIATGEASGLDPAAWSLESVAAFAYLLGFGSLLAFTAYVWLLQHAPVSKVSTYAYVNPLVAIVLGVWVLDEAITAATLVGAALIVASVALVIKGEQRARRGGPTDGDRARLTPEGETRLSGGAAPAILGPSVPSSPHRSS